MAPTDHDIRQNSAFLGLKWPFSAIFEHRVRHFFFRDMTNVMCVSEAFKGYVLDPGAPIWNIYLIAPLQPALMVQNHEKSAFHRELSRVLGQILEVD